MAPAPLLFPLLLFSLLRSGRCATSPQLPLSSIDCVHAHTFRDRRCFFRNVYVVDRVIWVVHEEPVDVPPLLCSAVDAPAAFVRRCAVEGHTPQELATRLAADGTELHHFDTGIAFSRLNPNNVYHTVMEEYIPMFELIRETPGLANWLEPPTHSPASQLLLFQDEFAPEPASSEIGRILFPAARRLEGPEPLAVFHVKLLVAGTRASCAHVAHCRRGAFRTPDVGTAFRRFFLERCGAPWEARRPRPPAPTVTVVQRSTTRRIANLDSVVAAVTGQLAALYAHARTVRVVDFGQMSLKRQILTALGTDILVLVHGGALGVVPFLPPHAIVVDIYPYGFLPALHGYIVNGIRLAMPSMHYGHLTVETADSSTTLLRDGLCLAPGCSGLHTISSFSDAHCLLIDPAQISRQVGRALLAWGSTGDGNASHAGVDTAVLATYAPPPTATEYHRKRDGFFILQNLTTTSCNLHVPCDAELLSRFQAAGHCFGP
eukprot:EG_transcript_10405